MILSSCQGNHFLSHLFEEVKEYSLTQLASQTTRSSLNAEDREELLYLFDDLESARTDCDRIQFYIENNKTLRFFEEQLALPRGFLFDELNDYNYESSLIQMNRSASEKAVFSVVSVWKTKISLKEIEQVISRVRKCYPKEYL